MAGRASLRASDADRERTADRLRKAAAEGRLLTEELEERLESAFSARTYGQLNAIVADIPGRDLTTRGQAPRLAPLSPTFSVAVVVAVAVTLALVAVVLVLTGVLAVWILWIVVGWWFWGPRRRRVARARGAGALRACGGWQRPPERPRGFRA
jgi:Flp pilus assembly protein TadB